MLVVACASRYSGLPSRPSTVIETPPDEYKFLLISQMSINNYDYIMSRNL